ncbi:MAG: nicotinate (nicotinamide) nucleotide adenylyltransferase [Phycisphaerales bacterium]|nr:nicotinate (nicotinamide) nucleotide adenylyltransferase [Phycisphaerales bacterium]
MTELPPLILAATDFELGAVRNALASRGVSAEFSTVGVGPGAVVRWSQINPIAQSDRSVRGRLVVLVGLAGALDPELRVGAVRMARAVVACGADCARPSPMFLPPFVRGEAVTIASVDRACRDAKSKCAIHASTHAALVDMESAAFAAVAATRGWNWGVMRVVGEVAHLGIPAWMSQLVHDDGSLNRVELVKTLLHPRRAVALMAMARDAKCAMHALGSALGSALGESLPEPPIQSRTLVFGGTFDPPHRRHCEIVAQAASLLRCDSIIIIPAGQSPLRLDHAAASSEDRLAMTRRAFAQLPNATIDTRELARTGRSFTVETLRELVAERQLARENLVLLIGADQAVQFDQWSCWREIDEKLATVAVVARPPRSAEELARDLAHKFTLLGSDPERWRRAVLPIESVELSASQVRARLASGAPIDDLVSHEVAQWIRQRALYA